MSDHDLAPLRIALLHPGTGIASVDFLASGELATALRAAGHEAVVLDGGRDVTRGPIKAPPLERWSDALLRARGFTGPVAHAPVALAALLRGGYDVAHAFSAPDALVARLWGRSVSRPAVFTCVETLDRGCLADRRLRLRLLTDAVELSDAVVAPGDDGRAALQHWLGVEPAVIAAGDASAHVQLYRALLASPKANRAIAHVS